MLRKFSDVVAGRPGSPVDESPSWLRTFQEEDEKAAFEKAVKLSKVWSSIQYPVQSSPVQSSPESSPCFPTGPRKVVLAKSKWETPNTVENTLVI